MIDVTDITILPPTPESIAQALAATQAQEQAARDEDDEEVDEIEGGGA